MDEQESDLSIPPSRLSFKKWFLLSTGILLAAISIPLLFNTDNYIKRLNSEMVSIRLFSKSLLWPSVTLGLLTSQRVFASSMTENWKNAETVYEFEATDLDGAPVSMDKYKDKVLIVVNVATYCGLTRANYAQLNDIYNEYKDRGLEIAGFPCNQFGNQEPGCSVDIKEFLLKNKVTWDVYDKVDVNGKDAHPLWKWLQHKKGGFITNGIKWNFTKFLIDRKGNPVKRYAPTDEPKTFVTDIEAELAK
ncbi:probable phospholipid hydroperoxide glutathione peroxidase isoform X1 [Tetranychus urticae]|uniref:probable phospholipid hydroperoxide glutathione peroxidase isoform X1 n=1 Tax=Tetranychus urticae TaxID=32264 RepID=UPI00077B87FB|nr:probable phospholipid hydroperoxide glutathione peroxidase isoform X1 [Tetranychus urticae]